MFMLLLFALRCLLCIPVVVAVEFIIIIMLSCCIMDSPNFNFTIPVTFFIQTLEAQKLMMDSYITEHVNNKFCY